MALVFKIKFQDTLRRWVICQNFSEAARLPTFQQLDAKIRELFHLASTASIVITYVNKNDDVVTLAEDDELLDACLEQWLNPLHLHVKVHDQLQNVSATQSTASADSPEEGNVDTILRAVPGATAVSKNQRFPQANEPKLPAAVPLGNAHNAANEFLKALTRESGWEMDDGYQASPASSENRTHDPHAGHTDTGHSSPLRCQSGKGASILIVHRGVQCDSCGMSPIKGSRFTSKRMFNNDLCSSCFEAFGNETDYQRIEHPGHPPSDILHNPPCAARGLCVILECHEGKDEQVCALGKGIDKLVIKAAEQGSTKECSTDTAGVAAVPVDFFVDENGQFEHHGPTVVSSELDGFSAVGKPVENVDVFINQETFLQGKPIQIWTDQEVKLQLLESMGYTDHVLNADLLEKNNQNLELTFDDLDVAAGWDDILTELQEMGFDDKSTNRRLLIKNQGSMKWVVKQLVQMEKQKFGQM